MVYADWHDMIVSLDQMGLYRHLKSRKHPVLLELLQTLVEVALTCCGIPLVTFRLHTFLALGRGRYVSAELQNVWSKKLKWKLDAKSFRFRDTQMCCGLRTRVSTAGSDANLLSPYTIQCGCQVWQGKHSGVVTHKKHKSNWMICQTSNWWRVAQL